MAVLLIVGLASILAGRRLPLPSPARPWVGARSPGGLVGTRSQLFYRSYSNKHIYCPVRGHPLCCLTRPQGWDHGCTVLRRWSHGD